MGTRRHGGAPLWVDLFNRHWILNASAISFQALKALVPLLPGVLGLSNVWDDQLRESFARQFTRTVFVAIDTAVGNCDAGTSRSRWRCA